MTFSLIVLSGEAFACGNNSFKDSLKAASIVFEGHVIAYEAQSSGAQSVDIIESYIVDKGWSHVEKGQIIKRICSAVRTDAPLLQISEIKLPQVPDKPKAELFLLCESFNSKGELSEDYLIKSCDKPFPLTLMNKLNLALKFPKKIFQ